MTYVTANTLLTPHERALLRGQSPTGAGKNFRLKVDVKEEENRYVLKAEIPGFTEKDIEVKIEDNLLTIASILKNDTDEKSKYLIKERRNLNFTRSFVLPKDVDKEKITASARNGILTLDLEKAEKSLPREIEVKGD